MDSQSKKIKINLISTILCQVITIGIGFILPKLYIENFGSETNGVLSVIKQIFTYLVLLEAGIGVAARQAIYKPIAEKKYDDVNSVLAAAKYYYTRSGIFYVICVAAIAIGYSLYTYFAGLAISPITVFLLVVLNGVPSIIAFFVAIKYQVLLEADGTHYILTNSETILQVVNGFMKVAVILLTKSLVLMQATYAICAVAQLLFVTFYTRKKYPWLDFKVSKNTIAVSQKNSVVVHSVSNMVLNNTDIILLSFLCNPVVGSIYSVYNLFFSQVENFFYDLLRGFSFSLGQLYAVDKKSFKSAFDIFEMGTVMSANIIFTLMCVFLLPIIKIYTHDTDYAADYVVPTLLFLFTLSKLIATAKQPSHQLVEYCGAFKDTRWHAIAEMSINIVLTVVCVITFNGIWGIPGALCGALVGTVAASLFRNTVMVLYVNKKILQRNPLESYKCFFANGLVFAIVYLIFNTGTFLELSFWELCLKGITYAPLIILAFIASNAIFQPKKFKGLLTMAKNKFSKPRHGKRDRLE